MDHNDIRHKLSEFIDGAITPSEKAGIEQHLKTCSECADALAELRKTIEHIHAIEEVESPAWMTQKIMAKVRTEAEEKKGLFHRLFYPLAVKLPIQTVAVLFLAVTAFYIYQGINPTAKYAEAPMERTTKKEARTPYLERNKHAGPDDAKLRANKIPQAPEHKSLDMKYEYEKPAPPIPQDRMVASAPVPAKRAAPSAGAVQHTEDKREAVSEARKTKKTLVADREADVQLDVTEHFVKVDLPEKMKIKGLTYTIRKVEKDITDLGWMRESITYRSKLCTNRYVVDVDLSGKLSKYLYCYDHSRITLLGVYELKDGTWSEIK